MNETLRILGAVLAILSQAVFVLQATGLAQYCMAPNPSGAEGYRHVELIGRCESASLRSEIVGASEGGEPQAAGIVCEHDLIGAISARPESGQSDPCVQHAMVPSLVIARIQLSCGTTLSGVRSPPRSMSKKPMIVPLLV